MEITLNNVLVCGVRDIKGKNGNTYYFCDWYCQGAKSSIVDAEKVNDFKTLVGKNVTLDIRIEEGRDRVNYRILNVLAK